MQPAHTLTRPAPQPPGPPFRWLGFKHLVEMRADYGGFTTRMRDTYGDVVAMRFVNERAVDVFDPGLVRELLVGQADRLGRWERGLEVFEAVFGQSLLVTEGAVWQRQRRILQPAFLPGPVAGYAAHMIAATGDSLAKWVRVGTEPVIDMGALFTDLTMDVIMRTLFGSPAGTDGQRVEAAIQTLSQIAMREMFRPMTLPDWLPLPGKRAKRAALRSLRGLLSSRITTHAGRAADEGVQSIATDSKSPRPTTGADLLSRLKALRDDEHDGAALDETELFDTCMVIFQAGHETTATALLWWSGLVAAHPAIAARLHEEVDAVLGDRAPDAADVSALPLLNASLKEAMRLYPPAAILMSRRALHPVRVGPYELPAGTLIRITPWAIQRDPRLFENPERFDPARFLPGAPPIPRGAWMPFGTGPRVCIGQHFAMLEMALIGARLLQRFTLEAIEPTLPGPLFNVTLRPDRPLRLRLKAR